MEPRVLVVADDMTGALDASAPMAAEGCAVSVHPGVADVRGVAVHAVNCGTRHAPPHVAAGVVHAVVSALAGRGTVVVKKTDSMLRGNVGAELGAVLAATGARVLHFIPALPSQGRTTVGGIQYSDGVPVAEACEDPFGPPVSSDVASVVADQCDMPVAHVPVGARVPQGFRGIAVHDAETRLDVERALAGVLSREGAPVLAGCSGLTVALAALRGSPRLPRWSMGEGEGLLWVCGSPSPVSRAQCATAEAGGARRIPFPRRAKLDGGWLSGPEGRATVVRAASSWGACRATVVDATSMVPGRGPEGLREGVADRLGRFCAAVVREAAPAPGPLMVSGGDVLSAALESLGVREIRPSGEALPGVVLSRSATPAPGLAVLSKSGGFGPPGLVREIAGSRGPRSASTARAVGKGW